MLDLLSRLKVSQLSNKEIITPKHVVDKMVSLIPDEIFNKDSIFLDPACKNGEYLLALKDRLMASKKMIEDIPDEEKRLKHILENQLYGLATSPISALLASKSVYKNINLKGNITYYDHYMIDLEKAKYDKIIEEAFGINMDFDVVIGNPPYQDSNGGGTDLVEYQYMIGSC